jgi:hypothetical protein
MHRPDRASPRDVQIFGDFVTQELARRHPPRR